MTAAPCFAATSQQMRPYTGIGVLVFLHSGSDVKQDLQLQMYEEPGLSRVGILNSSEMTGNEWIFGLSDGVSPLIVSARKSEWLRVYYDDAGREAWIEPQNKGLFQTWEQYLKMQLGRMLPGLQPQYYQLQQQPGGKPIATLTPKQVLKVLKTDNSWSMVLTDKSIIGWIRWCDDDGRLLIGLYR